MGESGTGLTATVLGRGLLLHFWNNARLSVLPLVDFIHVLVFSCDLFRLLGIPVRHSSTVVVDARF